jgi:hypothetical protein
MALRLARIAGVMIAFVIAFTMSQRATLAREGETVPGIAWAIGVLSMFFLISAFVSERFQESVPVTRRDMLWGLGIGGVGIVAYRLFQ